MSYTGDVQKLEPGAEIFLFILDMTALTGEVERFYPGNPLGDGPIIWQGESYAPWPIEVTGMSMTGDGQQSSPKLSVGDIDGSITALCAVLDDLVGMKLIRHRTLGQFLDAANFGGGNPDAAPDEVRVDSYLIERKSSQLPGEVIEFDLSSPLNFAGKQLPGRQIIQNVCVWLTKGGYRGPYCGYNGAAYFDADNNPVTDPALDVCGGRLSSCKCRFGANNPLSYGSQPSAGLTGS